MLQIPRKMKYLLVFLFGFAIATIAFIIAPTVTSPIGFVVADTEDKEDGKELPSFRIYTKAVCDNVSNFIVCHDELFAACGSFEYRLPKNEVNGKGIFNQDWEDPRNS